MYSFGSVAATGVGFVPYTGSFSSNRYVNRRVVVNLEE